MLQVVCAGEKPAWLGYVLDMFARQQGARFDVMVVQSGAVVADAPALYYAPAPCGGPTVPDRRGATPDGRVDWVDDSVYVLPGTRDKAPGFAIPYDLFRNAFIFLSRLEEYEAARAGRLTHSYQARHPREDKTTFAVPVVDHLFAVLRSLVERRWPNLVFEPAPARLELSHDVDYVTKTPQLRLKQTAFNAFNAVRSLGRNGFAGRVGRTLRFLLSNPPYDCFDYWAALEEGLGLRSVFYIYARCGGRGPRAWLLDPSYDVRADAALVGRLRSLRDRGFEIGLHGSFASADDAGRLKAELAALEDVLGCGVSKTRQHWLRYVEGVTPLLHEQLFAYDSTLGWNDAMGFRCGTACRHHPWDHAGNRVLGHEITPQLIMDSNIYDYGAGCAPRLLEEAEAMLDRVAALPGAHAAISWHQRVRSSDYGWHVGYEHLVAGRPFPGEAA